MTCLHSFTHRLLVMNSSTTRPRSHGLHSENHWREWERGRRWWRISVDYWRNASHIVACVIPNLAWRCLYNCMTTMIWWQDQWRCWREGWRLGAGGCRLRRGWFCRPDEEIARADGGLKPRLAPLVPSPIKSVWRCPFFIMGLPKESWLRISSR